MKKGRNSGDEEEGRQLWQSVTQGVKAYSPRKKPLPPKGTSPVRKTARPQPKPVLPSRASTPGVPEPKGFDRATETKFRRGQLMLEARLDLHGMTQQEAFDALCRFIHYAVRHEIRTVLVITGKGGVTSGGVLKRMLPLWLEEPSLKKHLLALTPAQPKAGGTGAFYLRLRKAK